MKRDVEHAEAGMSNSNHPLYGIVQAACEKAIERSVFFQVQAACEAAIRESLGLRDLVPRRLLTMSEAAGYLSLSVREIADMISSHEITPIRRGRRVLLDIRDLNQWISAQKADAQMQQTA